MYGVKEFRAEVNGGSVPCISFGRGSRPLVKIPGLRTASIEGTGGMISAYYRMFAKEYRVWIIDRKDVLPENPTIGDLAEDTAAVMSSLGITGADVWGTSQGGMIAQYIAIKYPELVGRLVLAVTASRVNDTVTDAVNTWIRFIENNDINGFAGDYIRRGYSEAYLKKYRLFLPLALKAQKMMPAKRFISLARACLTVDTYNELDRIKCPVLVLGGAEDKVVTGEASREIAEKLGCECVIYEGLSHEAYNEAKDFNRRILDFFTEKQ